MGTSVDLCLIICSHRTISVPTVVSLDRLRHNLNIEWSLVIQQGDALISRARSMACTHFLDEQPAPYMLFLDDDILFSPQDVQKIYNSLINGYDIIGGLYPVRGAYQLASYGWGGVLPVDNQIREIEFLATGFMGISRRALEKIRDGLKLPILNPDDWSRCYPFFESKRVLAEERARGGAPIYISEDWDFNQKARQVGIKVYADCSVQVGHLREQLFLPRDVVEVQGKQSAEKQVFGSMREQQELILSVDTDLSEFLKEPLIDVQRKIGRESQEKLAELWQQRSGSIEDFYKDNKAYLYDLAASNRYLPYFQERLGGLVNISKLKVLDIGCGLGTAVFLMAGQGNEAVGWDINSQCIEFCKFKKQKYKLGGEFVSEKPDFSQFDLMIAVDMLEHIEDLRGFLLELGKAMKSGAKLYHSDYFPKGKVWPMHFEEHAQHLNEWLKEAGFACWDSTWAVKL